MRTTLDLDDALYTQVKVLAAQHNRTITSVVEDALRRLLLEHSHARRPVDLLRSDRQGGALPGVDINDGRALRRYLDG